jgi:hypothetical protein
MGIPLRDLDLGGSDAVQIEHQTLAGSFDPQLALVQFDDLTGRSTEWTIAPEETLLFSNVIGGEFCGQSPELEGQLGDTVKIAYVDEKNNAAIFSEVARVRQTRDIDAYLRETNQILTGCPDNRYYNPTAEGREEVTILDNRADPPVVDYVSRSLEITDSGRSYVVTYFQVGDVLVAIQYAGPHGSELDLMDDLEQAILARVVPTQFGEVQDVPGAKDLPPEDEVTTTTLADPTAPSETSTPDRPEATFSPETTARSSDR